MSRAIRGLDCYLYVSNDGGTTWALVACARDVSYTKSADTIDVSRRKVKNRQYLVGLRDFVVNGTLIKDDTDDGYNLLKAAVDGETSFKVLVLDGDKDVTGPTPPVAKGYETTCFVGDWEENQALEEGVQITFSLVNDPSDDPAPVTGPVT